MSSGTYDTVASAIAHQGLFARVRVDRVRTADGTEVEREVIEQDDAVAVVPVFDDGTVLLLRQYRHPVGRYLLEIPAGKLDIPGETPEAAAQRELIEEVEHRAGRLEHLITVHNSAGWTDEQTHLYIGTALQPVGPPEAFAPTAEEADMEIVRVPLEEAVARIRQGEISDAKTVIGLLLAAGRGA